MTLVTASLSHSLDAESFEGEKPLKNLYIKTYGCQMNVYDSERMEELLHPWGYRMHLDVQSADLLILNTCHIRAKAEEKLFSDLGRYRALKKKRENQGHYMMIVVAGCVGQALGKEIIRKAPFVDAVVGPQTYQCLPETLAKILREVDQEKERRRLEEEAQSSNQVEASFNDSSASSIAPLPLAKTPKPAPKGIVGTGFPSIAKFDELIEKRSEKGASRFLSIQEGCDKFCRYCVVPYTRGAEYSRPVMEIVQEAKQLVDFGAKEITVLGQNVNAYHGVGKEGDIWGLGKLLFELAKISGIQRLRYTTSHPRDVDDELIAAHRDIDVLMPFLHLPVQSGSNRILAHMNRQYTVERYLEIIESLRKVRPGIAFSSDFIVGYPDESDQDFEETCALVKAVGYAQAYSFEFSPRPGTPAAVSKKQVDPQVKKERLSILQSLICKDQLLFNQSMKEKTVPVLIEKIGKYPGQWIGKSPFMQSVYFKDDQVQIGDMVHVQILDGYDNSLSGVRV
jgi:tRNA-2-methylthio-N6-dimethylallyladenosine synthase